MARRSLSSPRPSSAINPSGCGFLCPSFSVWRNDGLKSLLRDRGRPEVFYLRPLCLLGKENYEFKWSRIQYLHDYNVMVYDILTKAPFSIPHFLFMEEREFGCVPRNPFPDRYKQGIKCVLMAVFPFFVTISFVLFPVIFRL